MRSRWTSKSCSAPIPPLRASSPTGMTTSGSTNFNVTPSETQDFYQGLLEPVEPQTLALFKEQGIARRDLVLSLHAAGRRRTARRGPPNSIRQRPARSELRRFSSLRRAGDALRTVRRTDARRQTGQVGQGGDKADIGQVEQRRFDERAGHGLAALFQPQGLGAGHALRRQPSAVRFEREDEGPSHRDVPRPQRETGDGARLSAFDLLDLPVSRTARRRRRRGPDQVDHRASDRARAARG